MMHYYNLWFVANSSYSINWRQYSLIQHSPISKHAVDIYFKIPFLKNRWVSTEAKWSHLCRSHNQRKSWVHSHVQWLQTSFFVLPHTEDSCSHSFLFSQSCTERKLLINFSWWTWFLFSAHVPLLICFFNCHTARLYHACSSEGQDPFIVTAPGSFMFLGDGGVWPPCKLVSFPPVPQPTSTPSFTFFLPSYFQLHSFILYH